MAKEGEGRGRPLRELTEKKKPGRPSQLTDAEKKYVFNPTYTEENDIKHMSDVAKRSVDRVIFWKGKTLEYILNSDLKYSTADFRYDRKHGYLKGAPHADGTKTTVKGGNPKSVQTSRSIKEVKPSSVKEDARSFANAQEKRAADHISDKREKKTKLSPRDANVNAIQINPLSDDLKKKNAQIEELTKQLEAREAQREECCASWLNAMANADALEKKLAFYKVAMYICMHIYIDEYDVSVRTGTHMYICDCTG